MLDAQLLILAKEPVPGRVKTRLTPPLTPEQAAAVAKAALVDTLAVAARLPVRRRVLVLDGTAGDWLVPGFDVIPQRGTALGERLAAAYDDAFAACPLPALLIGMDTPQVSLTMLAAATSRLLEGDVVLGHATDGGWWALGLHAPNAALFDGVPMSTENTGRRQEAALRDHHLVPVLLPELRDIDRIEDLLAVAAQLPASSALAAAVRGLDLTATMAP